VLTAGGRVADPDEAKSRDAAGELGRVRRLARSDQGQVSPPRHGRSGVGGREVPLDGQRPGAGGVQPELELGDHAEVAAASRRPQKSSEFSAAEARTTSPAAVTAVKDRTLSQESPYCRASQPIPPPR
jgi:hypothetical protein